MPFNDDFPIPLAKFAPTVAGTNHEVWMRLMALTYGNACYTEKQWHALLAKQQNNGATPAKTGSK